VFVPKFLSFELRPVSFLVDLFEDVFEAAVLHLHDGVFGAHLHRQIALQTLFEAGVCEVGDGLVSVVHGHGHSGVDALDHGVDLRLAGVGGGEDQLDFAGCLEVDVGRALLVAECVARHDDGVGPARHEARDVFADDGLSEDDSAQDVADGAVGRLPHLLELEFLHTLLIGGDGGALDAHVVLLDCVCAVHGHLVVSAVSVLHAQVILLQVHVQVWQHQTFLDFLPDYAGHLVSVKVHHRLVHLYSSTKHSLVSSKHIQVGC